ncbi:hypothetical protein MYCTH_2312344 [Thermothelomyces thermophilus ATCC 42464]|uniref:Myb-like domain-containing protein n=1 Tax=Thermothelomyces thermophilus (strain ATCC 42464 / BCRC 31852 / DSM 1799) TaxID=573729 RepID=G2QQC2_THET4|nr:uncharacterized protein MYCTH_2312344 [Thermothelomyces thermophilus ATCC 42464]AEO61785.1 hypothetical protein MYCTH_2312344 [Thermothelomyces thermophilus ATCC 42464]
MMNKNWNDRADKDLFFTILSVKNIGVISGTEWVTIGNHMRSLGYGFTNEGCRQHFQGLRRAQAKAENGVAGDNPRKIDPTLNPITRRPGPGRGRPRKQPAADAAASVPPAAPASGVHPGGTAAGGAPPGAPGTPSGAPALVPGTTPIQNMSHGLPVHAQFTGLPGVSPAPPTPASTVPGPSGTPAMANAPDSQGLPQGQGQAQPPPPQTNPGVAPQAQMAAHEELAVDPSLGGEPEEEHAAKRQRLDDSQEPTLEDEAVLNALASHNNPTTPGEYTTEYSYGDA